MKKYEINSVTISLHDYLNLRDFKLRVEAGLSEQKFAVIESNGYRNYNAMDVRYYTESEIIADFETEIKKLKENINELKETQNTLTLKHWEEINELKCSKKKFETNTINSLKDMSYWEFIKMKKRINAK